MNRQHFLLIGGAILVIFGVVAPIMMVMRYVEPTFWLSFLSFAATVGGVFMGMFWMAGYARQLAQFSRKDKHEEK